jgi:hypothetical protein
MKKVLLGILLYSTFVGVSYSQEQHLASAIAQPLHALLENANNLSSEELDSQCTKTIEELSEIISTWNDELSGKLFLPIIKHLQGAWFSDAAYKKLAKTLQEILLKCNERTIQNSATAHGADGRASCSRMLFRKLLQLSRQDFLNIAMPVLDLVTFLEVATPGVFQASLQYIERISEDFTYMKNLLKRKRVSQQDTEVARAFFQKFPSEIIDQLAEIIECEVQ